jgi:hypothetical protein
MNTPVHDVAQIRLANALILFDEYVRSTVSHADAATLRGLESRFAERLQIQPSYWSQIKSRSRQIGERLARQFESLCRKPYGWMDEPHFVSPQAAPVKAVGAQPDPRLIDPTEPADADERFVVGLVLTYYRRNPQRARQRLLDLLGEVLVTPTTPPPTRTLPKSVAEPEVAAKMRQGVVPLKRKR